MPDPSCPLTLTHSEGGFAQVEKVTTKLNEALHSRTDKVRIRIRIRII